MADLNTTRRRLLGAMAVVPALALTALPALATSPTPFRIAADRYRAATDRFNNLPRDLETTSPEAHAREERAYLATVDDVDTAPCATWEEFGEAFEIATDNGNSLPNDDLVMKLLADVRRLRQSATAEARHA